MLTLIEGSTLQISWLVAGWSDWLDGYVARRFNQQSVIGSYLDPLADKALICCVVGALGVQVCSISVRKVCFQSSPSLHDADRSLLPVSRLVKWPDSPRLTARCCQCIDFVPHSM